MTRAETEDALISANWIPFTSDLNLWEPGGTTLTRGFAPRVWLTDIDVRFGRYGFPVVKYDKLSLDVFNLLIGAE